MHTVSCTVALTGFSIQKTDVTPTELAILKSLHGDAAISEVEPTADIERTDAEEFTRLVKIYGPNAPVALVTEFDAPEPEATEAVESEGEATDEAPKPKPRRRAAK